MILHQLALVKREIWEHRSLYVTPAVVGLVLVLLALTALVFASDYQELVDIFIVGAQNIVGDAERRAAMFALLVGNTIPFLFAGAILTIFYALDSLYAERKNKSILFWRSLPITDAEMTRFWITLQQGVDFVLSSLATMSGGEIFIPKIPSMKVIDVARALAPDLDHKIVGIRPGEKLHELMVTVDDARTTLELEDRYIIEPQFAFWSNAHLIGDGASAVDSGFEYASNINTDWLDRPALIWCSISRAPIP